MLYVNGMKVPMKFFPNREIYLDFTTEEGKSSKQVFHNSDLPKDKQSVICVGMQFEGNDDLIGLLLLASHLRDLGYQRLELSMPYIPYSTMDHIDREKSRPLSLKYVAQMINSMNFERVMVMEPHSTVSNTMIDRLEIKDKTLELFEKALRDLNATPDKTLVIYPDEGAMKRYAGMLPGFRSVMFTKNRNFEDGKLNGSRCIDPLPAFTEDYVCIILDDLCRGGYTFELAANELIKSGCQKVVLCVTHLEKVAFEPNRVLRNDSPVYRIYATDSCLPEFDGTANKLVMEKVGRYPFEG